MRNGREKVVFVCVHCKRASSRLLAPSKVRRIDPDNAADDEPAAAADSMLSSVSSKGTDKSNIAEPRAAKKF